MFNTATHLPQLLRPDQYRSSEQYQLELERLFLPVWHFVCTTADLPRDGDFLTMEFCSRPVLVRNFGGEYQAFLNVCPHRFCRLSGLSRGRSRSLQCQYHGWEFDCTGQTRHIPDASNFRPLKKGQAELVPFRTERLGQLIFVNLSSEGPSLSQSLAAVWNELQSFVSDDWTQVMELQTGPRGNWKCAVEVTLEGYHVNVAHAASLGKFPQPDEDDWLHDLGDACLANMRAKLPRQKRFRQWLERLGLFLVRKPMSGNYIHIRSYPGFGCINQDLFTVVQSVLPTGPNEHINIYRLFVYSGPRTPLQRYLAWSCGLVAKPILRSLWRKTFAEDATLIRETQAGLESPQLPPGGLVSRREECVFHFQRYVQEKCNATSEQLGAQLNADVAVPETGVTGKRTSQDAPAGTATSDELHSGGKS